MVPPRVASIRSAAAAAAAESVVARRGEQLPQQNTNFSSAERIPWELYARARSSAGLFATYLKSSASSLHRCEIRTRQEVTAVSNAGGG